MSDVIIVGAGPAGSVAATVLARAGARVRLIDRATFPRDKLCGDSLNPGTMAALRRLGLSSSIETSGEPVHGMVLTREDGLAIEGRYPGCLAGRAVRRRELDWVLLREAIRAGAAFEEDVSVVDVLSEHDGSTLRVRGVKARSRAGVRTLRAAVTIAADGRRSRLAFRLGLLGHPRRPRRWAVGGYFERVAATSSLGELHIRRGRYIALLPVGDGLTNVCLVRPAAGADAAFQQPAAALRRELVADPLLRDRFADARLIARPTVLGPLAVDATAGSAIPEGLLLAGDAAGFIDPMTGDGMHFAVRGAELAAGAAHDALASGWRGVHGRLAAARQREFAPKWRFNRLMRGIVGSPAALHVATGCARLTPSLVRALVTRAGDCDCA